MSLQSIRKKVSGVAYRFTPTRLAIQRIALDDRFLYSAVSGHLFYKRISASQDLSRKLASEIVNRGLLPKLTESRLFVESISQEDPIVSAVSENPRVWQSWVENGKAVSFLQNDPSLISRIATNQSIISSILKTPSSQTAMFENSDTISRIASDTELLDRIVNDPEIFRGMLGNQHLIARLLRETHFAEQTFILASNQIIKNPSFLSRFLHTREAISAISSDAEILREVIANPNSIKNLEPDQLSP
ncbi:MAG: hypothetical protein KC964_30970, partial [Candidatus Omnitrophica bacterium]|nr:hypothetical protein [Candidatus Omnitrophota bacterium]